MNLFDIVGVSVGLAGQIKANYVDGNGLVTPDKATFGVMQGSDNGPMYTSEFYIMWNKRVDGLSPFTISTYASLMNSCIDSNGLLNRVPTTEKSSQEGPDDYYGVLNACMQLGITSIPLAFLKATVRFMGALNNVEPGKWTAQSFLIRQPQLLCAMIAASFPSKRNPLHIAIRSLFYPLFLLSAIIIATSCILVPPSNTDARRLSWHLLQTLSPVSIPCRIAASIWYYRLYKDYGPTGMRGVAAIYYHPTGEHPFAKFWVD